MLPREQNFYESERLSINSKQLRLLLGILLFGVLQGSLLYGKMTQIKDTSSQIREESAFQDKHQHHLPRCLQILAIGTSVTAGSPGFHAAHPDAPKPFEDPWPQVMEKLLNAHFPCFGSNNTSDSIHSVVNKAWYGCGAQCHLQKWPENYDVYSQTEWDLIIVEITTGGSTGKAMLREVNELQALIAALTTLPLSEHASFILLSASFRLKDENHHPKTYEELPEIERGVADLAIQWGIPFVSFPKYIFSHELYNSSNHQAHCLEARCNFWLDRVHITKTSHRIIAMMLLHAITTNTTSEFDMLGNDTRSYNATFHSLTLPERPHIVIDELPPMVKELLPSFPVVWITFRTKTLPNTDSSLICFNGFRPHNSRERWSTMYEGAIANLTNNSSGGGEKPHENATLLLKMPTECENDLRIQLEYLNSYTTMGALDLVSWVDGDTRNNYTTDQLCEDSADKDNNFMLLGTFNSSNEEKVSVSKSASFKIDRNTTFVKGRVYGGDFHLLSLGIYCL